jgi:hypothetical protein
VWCFKRLRLRHVQVGLFCEDYPNLQDRQVSKIETEFPEWLGKLTYQRVWNFELAEEFGGGVIALRNLDKLEKYKSAEFAAIAVLGAVMNRYSRILADEFVISGFVHVLKATPTADIVDENGFVIDAFA